MNTVCPPTPVYICWPIDSAETCPVRSTCSALLTVTKFSIWISRRRSSVWPKSYSSKTGWPSIRSISSGAGAERAADDLARVDRLAVAGDHAALDEVDDAAGDQLGLHAEVVLVVEVHAERRRHGADAHLQRVAVVDQLGGDQRADDLDGGDLLVAQRRPPAPPLGRVGLDDGVERRRGCGSHRRSDEVLVDLAMTCLALRESVPESHTPDRSCTSRCGRW
jgi:hypothetical protein